MTKLATTTLGCRDAVMRMDAVARGSSMSGIAREPQETEKTGVSLAVLLRPDWVYSD